MTINYRAKGLPHAPFNSQKSIRALDHLCFGKFRLNQAAGFTETTNVIAQHFVFTDNSKN